MTVERLTPDEMTEIARGVVTNVYYVAWTPEQVEYSFGGFLALIAGGLEAQGQDTSWMQDVGLVYAEWSKAMSHGVNGYPSFLTAQYIHKDDRWPFQRECMRLSVAIGEIKQEELDQFDADLAEYERRKAAETQEGTTGDAGA